MKFNTSFEKRMLKTQSLTTSIASSKLNWRKVDKEKYKSKLSCELSKHTYLNTEQNLNKTVETINSIMVNCAKSCAPQPKKPRKRKPKLRVMTPIIQTAIQKKKKAFYNWKCAGRPNSLDNFYLIEKKLSTATEAN